jgi:hypothetical protein
MKPLSPSRGQFHGVRPEGKGVSESRTSSALNTLGLSLALVVTVVTLTACTSDVETLGEQQVVDAAWEALKPNTSSHDRTNWSVVEADEVTGSQVAAQFEGEAALGCWKGPTPVPNQLIRDSGSYWYVQMAPHPVTRDPRYTPISPTAPPPIPEPFLREARFLIDAQDGSIVARKLFCVIY